MPDGHDPHGLYIDFDFLGVDAAKAWLVLVNQTLTAAIDFQSQKAKSDV